MRFAGTVEALEKTKSDFTEVAFNFTATVMLAYASIEAYVTETVFYDRNTTDDEKQKFLESRKNVLDRTNEWLDAKGRPKLRKGRRPYQDADRLAYLRDALVHFKPEWGNDPKFTGDLEKRVPKLGFSHLSGDAPRIYRYMTTSYAVWAVRVAFLFLESFASNAGAEFRLERYREMLPAEPQRASSKPCG